MLAPQYNSSSFQNLYETLGNSISQSYQILLVVRKSEEKVKKLNLKELLETISAGINYIIVDLSTTIRSILRSTSQYENAYHTKNAYAIISEAYKFLYTFRLEDESSKKNTVLHYLVLELQREHLDGLIPKVEEIIQDIETLSLKIDRDKRDIPYHYSDNIEKIYDITTSMNADKAMKDVVIPFLGIIQNINNIIINLQPLKCFELDTCILRNNHILAKEIHDIISESISKKNLYYVLGIFIEKGAQHLDEYYKHKQRFKKSINFFENNNVDKQYIEKINDLDSIASTHILVLFMAGDIACLMRNYISAEDFVEKEISLARVYITACSFLEHLIGFDETERCKCLCVKIEQMIPDTNLELKNEFLIIKEQLIIITKLANKKARTTIAHYLKRGKVSITEIIELLSNIDLCKSFSLSETLINVFKEMEHFLTKLMNALCKEQAMVRD